MDTFIDNIISHLISVDWEGTAMFSIIVFAILAVLKQWKILLITLLTVALVWGFQDLIIMNIETEMAVISIPLIIYCTGGGAILLLLVIFFLKASI